MKESGGDISIKRHLHKKKLEQNKKDRLKKSVAKS